MNAAAGHRSPQRRLVTKTMDVNITTKRVHVPTPVQTRLQSCQPKDAMDDGGAGHVGKRADGNARLEHGSFGLIASDLPGNSMQTQGRAIRVNFLPNPKARGRSDVVFPKFVVRDCAFSFRGRW